MPRPLISFEYVIENVEFENGDFNECYQNNNNLLIPFRQISRNGFEDEKNFHNPTAALMTLGGEFELEKFPQQHESFLHNQGVRIVNFLKFSPP